MNPNFKPQATPAPLTTPTITRTDARAILDYLHRTRAVGHTQALMDLEESPIVGCTAFPGATRIRELPDLESQPVRFDNSVVHQLCLLALQQPGQEAIRVEVFG